MEIEKQQELIETVLTHVADTLGDITPAVMGKYYERYPEAKQLFESLSLGKPRELEGTMLEQTIYCLMTVLRRPEEIRVMLQDSMRHHETLTISANLYHGLIDCTIDVIEATLPAENAESENLLDYLRKTLKEMAT